MPGRLDPMFQIIERAQALIPRGNSFYRLARDLGFKKEYKKAKGMTEQLERLISPPAPGRRAEAMIGTVQSKWYALRTRRGLRWKSIQAVDKLCDELLALLMGEEKRELYRKMDSKIAMWNGFKRRIEDDENYRVSGGRVATPSIEDDDDPEMSGGSLDVEDYRGASAERTVAPRVESENVDQRGFPVMPKGW
ncbi:hypothetical protein CLAFUW4_10811 [Fulvia fulva]|nr:hypothetical protein CLAFUR4_10816 [Fulvia fulva]KAK4620485.1 hypothetical protein CLAFUR0_10823 [Fulvia fulva]WPV17214.1 hypothetical protein CLAFUW4_10811 [Fulvia fulva]WPV32016.1 hypothetical protein CLAFUW7_10809 [Fulvia fulva]